MSSEKARELEQRGINAARAGQKDQARKLLQHALRLDPTSDTAWLWLASVARDKRERLLCLQKVLEINPHNETAVKAVQSMGIDPEKLVPRRATIADSLAEPGGAPITDESGIPLPGSARIQDAVDQIQPIFEPFLSKAVPEGITWTRKSSQRAGEREVWILRAQVFAALATFSIIVLGLAIYGIANSPRAQLVLFGATDTPIPPTRTPTPTFTPRPDISPTVTPTVDFTAQPTFTPSPTVNPNIVSWPLDRNLTPVYQTPTATRLYLNAENNALATAIFALEQDTNIEGAIDRMLASQREDAGSFGPYPYYYEALLLLRQEQDEQAIQRLEVAQARLDDIESPNAIARQEARLFQPVIDVGFSRVYLEQIRDALEVGNVARADELIEQIETRVENAAAIVPTYADPYVVLAEAYILRGRFEDAVELLSQDNLIEPLNSNIDIITTRGEALLEQGRALRDAGDTESALQAFSAAGYQGFLGLYVSPFSDAAHQLRIEAALAMEEPGLASIYTNQYLFYRPQSAPAFRLLATARLAEDKPDLALDVYSQAIEQSDTDATLADVYLSRAGLYNQQRRYDLALNDLTVALELEPSLNTQFIRMQAAYNAGELELAREDAEDLIEAGFAASDSAQLVRAQVIVDREETADYESALADLETITNDLPTVQQAIAYDYQARINLARGELDDALDAINAALTLEETATRRYLRAQIYEASGETDLALKEYEWLITWNTVYDFPFADAVQTSLDAILQPEMPEATPTSDGT
ncbi:MAG: tetratricopeptide repeat protein [Chloroflexota bacterium]